MAYSAPNTTSSKLTNYFSVTADMTSATWNTQAQHEIAIVTGIVNVKIMIECTQTLTDAADGASIQFGIEGTTNAWIASTQCAGAGANFINGGEIWVDNSPTETHANTSTAIFDKVVCNGLDIGYEITGAALTGGTLVFHVWWEGLNATGSVSAGAGGTL